MEYNSLFEDYINVDGMDFNIPKSMAILTEELRKIASGLNELIGKNPFSTYLSNYRRFQYCRSLVSFSRVYLQTNL